MRYELDFEAEPFARHDEFLESSLDQEDFPRTSASATVMWDGPWPLSNASSQLERYPRRRWSGVYIVALVDATQRGGYRPIRVGESGYFPRRLKDYLSTHIKTNPLLRPKFQPRLTFPNPSVYFFFGRIHHGDRKIVQNAIARIFLRAGVKLTHHDTPRIPAKVYAGAPITIRNVLPDLLKHYLADAYKAGGPGQKDPGGKDITGPYPSYQTLWAPQNILHLKQSDTPFWEAEAEVGDRDGGRWIRVGNRLIVLGG
jgi:hypothetical protein